MKKLLYPVYGIMVAACLLGIAMPAPACAESNARAIVSIPVYVSILPQSNFVERIGGERVSVNVLIPPGKSPAVYAPTPAQVAGLAQAKIYFRIGVPFENALMPKIKNAAPNTLVVDTRKGIKLRSMKSSHHHGHEEEHEAVGEGRNHSMGKDPHIWMDPMLVKIQANTICQALINLDPLGKPEYENNLKEFSRDLDSLNEKIARALEPVKGSTVFVFHPTFGYLCDAYGLKQMAIEEEGKSPKGKNLANFIAKARKKKVRIVFTQPQFDQNAARKIAQAIGGAVVSMDPLAHDYMGNMTDMARVIARSMGQ